MSDDLIAFLRARLDEDEQVAQRAALDSPGPWLDETGPDRNGYHEGKIRCTGGFTVVHVEDQTPQPETAAHIARWDPARVLAEVEAKRRMLDWCDRMEIVDGHGGLMARDARKFRRWLALPYADHPDYRGEWRPVAE